MICKSSISGCTYFFFTGNPNTWFPETHPPTQIRTLFGFVNPYELLDAPSGLPETKHFSTEIAGPGM